MGFNKMLFVEQFYTVKTYYILVINAEPSFFFFFVGNNIFQVNANPASVNGRGNDSCRQI